MPQIGWFELLIIIVISILVIGPKDFPIVLRKVGNWIGSVKRYFSEVQRNVNEITDNESMLYEDKENEKKHVKKNEDKER
ncbi:MAG: Sec-independent protein translocase protein TatB [Pelagibacteraceae bacterium]|tara:strand:- start:119 stop:358 length:240 start_codon:yes stop_codon:yes gene_type:complete